MDEIKELVNDTDDLDYTNPVPTPNNCVNPSNRR